MRWRFAAALACSLALVPLDAQAGPRVTVAVARPDDPVALRLQAELAALGFEVDTVQAPELVPSRQLLEATARDRGAIAALRIVPSTAGVEVWIFDRVTGKTVLREVVTDPAPGGGAVEVIALRTVELLRASLMEVEADHPSRGEVEPAPVVRRAIARRPRRRREGVALGLGPWLAGSPGGLGPSLQARAGATWPIGPRVRAGVSAIVPLLPAELSGPEGSASATLLGAGAELLLALGRPSRLRLSVGTGAQLMLLHLSGSARAGWVGQSDDLVTLVPHALARLHLALSRRVRVTAEVLTGIALPQPEIRFGGRPAATWGLPLLAASLGMEVEL